MASVEMNIMINTAYDEIEQCPALYVPGISSYTDTFNGCQLGDIAKAFVLAKYIPNANIPEIISDNTLYIAFKALSDEVVDLPHNYILTELTLANELIRRLGENENMAIIFIATCTAKFYVEKYHTLPANDHILKLFDMIIKNYNNEMTEMQTQRLFSMFEIVESCIIQTLN